MDNRLGDSLWRKRFSAIIVGTFSRAALAIAILGVFGMTRYVVAIRTFEIRMRAALGATRLDVLWMMLRQSIGMAILGVVLGVLGSVAATHVLSMFLFGVKAGDPLTLGGVDLLLIEIPSASSYIPVRRAAAVDQGKRILIPQQMQEVVIVPPCFEAFPVDTAF